MDRESAAPVEHWHATEAMRKAYSKKLCLAPAAFHHECSKVSARAHTIPRAGALQKISRDGHVYGFPINSIIKAFTSDGVPVARLVGIHDASVFTGFCTKHDNDIFAPIEKCAFVMTPEQCFLLGHRAQAREFYTKAASASMSEFRRDMDRGRSLDVQVGHQVMSRLIDVGLGAGLADSNHHKQVYDQVLVSKSFGRCHGYVACVPERPPFMCSGGFYPEEDFHGNRLQDVANLRVMPALIAISVFSDDDKGYVVLSWLDDSDPVCRRFAESLSATNGSCYASAVARMVFYHIENVYMSPPWWEGLKEEVRSALLSRKVMAVEMTTDYEPGKMLADDLIRIPPWTVQCETRIGY